MAFRILAPDEVLPERSGGKPTLTEYDEIAQALRAGERIEVPIDNKVGAKVQTTRLRGSMAYRGLAISVRRSDKFIYLSYGHEAPRNPSKS